MVFGSEQQKSFREKILNLSKATKGREKDFDLTEEPKMFWDSIPDFCDNEIAPLGDEAEAKEGSPTALFRKLGEVGFLLEGESNLAAFPVQVSLNSLASLVSATQVKYPLPSVNGFRRR